MGPKSRYLLVRTLLVVVGFILLRLVRMVGWIVLRLVWLSRGMLRYMAPINMTLSPLYQFDNKNAFLHGDLAEEPPGFDAQGESGLVCRLRHSLYCLK